MGWPTHGQLWDTYVLYFLDQREQSSSGSLPWMAESIRIGLTDTYVWQTKNDFAAAILWSCLTMRSHDPLPLRCRSVWCQLLSYHRNPVRHNSTSHIHLLWQHVLYWGFSVAAPRKWSFPDPYQTTLTTVLHYRAHCDTFYFNLVIHNEVATNAVIAAGVGQVGLLKSDGSERWYNHYDRSRWNPVCPFAPATLTAPSATSIRMPIWSTTWQWLVSFALGRRYADVSWPLLTTSASKRCATLAVSDSYTHTEQDVKYYVKCLKL